MTLLEETKAALEDAVAMGAIALIWAKGDPHEAITFLHGLDVGDDPHNVKYHVERGINMADDKLRERGLS